MPDDQNESNAGPLRGSSHSPRHGGRAMEAPILHLDLPAEIEQLRQQPSYSNGQVTGRTLVKEPDLRVVLIALPAGGRMTEHDASGPCAIQGLSGRVNIRLPESTVDVTAGHLLALESGIRHEVVAIEDSAFLVTIGRTTYERVSDRHEAGI